MRSFHLLETIPVGGDASRRRFFIDGQRVTFAEWFKLEQNADRIDCFLTERRGNRWHFRKVAHR